jgi:cytochrome c-type biogenesis protein CcmH
MIVFWLVCAIFVAIALAFVLPPLLQLADKKTDESDRKEANIAVYRDQIAELKRDLENGIASPDQYQQDRDELERRLLEDVSATVDDLSKQPKSAPAGRGPVYAIMLGLPVFAIALYLRVGNPGAMSASATAPSQPASAASVQGNEQFSQQRMEANVASLAKRLEGNPADTAGWIMLAHSYSSLEKYSEASAAYARATAVKTDDADLWADYAFALAMSSGRQLQGKPAELVAKALRLDPENPKALELAGAAAFEQKNYQQAIEYWQKLMQKTPADSEVGQALSQRIAEAKTLSGGSGAR